MRRQEIVDGTLQVVAALNETGVMEALGHSREMEGLPGGKPQQMSEQILEAYKRYLLAAQHYNAGARHVAATFGLEPLEAPGFWAGGGSGKEAFKNVRQTFRAVTFATEFLPKLVALLQHEALPGPAAGPAETSTHELLTLFLPEEAHQYSRPQRVADALLAISALYEAVALLEQQPENTLSVVACDSGSDKSFDLLGVAKLIATLKGLLLSVWDRVVFFRELQVAQRLELVASSLPILEKVSKLEQEQSIGPEQAEIIRRKVIQGVSQFLSCGGLIPEMGARSQVEPRQLMAPEAKLLTGGAAPEELQKKARHSRSRRKLRS